MLSQLLKVALGRVFLGKKLQYQFSVCYFKAGSRSELSLHLVSDSYVVYSGISIPVCTEISYGLSPDFGKDCSVWNITLSID